MVYCDHIECNTCFVKWYRIVALDEKINPKQAIYLESNEDRRGAFDSKDVDNYKVAVDYDNLPRNVYTLLLGRQSGDRKKIKKNPVREGVFIKEK